MATTTQTTTRKPRVTAKDRREAEAASLRRANAKQAAEAPTLKPNTTARDQVQREANAAALRAANARQARTASVRNGGSPDTATKNPPTTTNPATGKRQGPPRKPLTPAKAVAAAKATPAKATAKPVTRKQGTGRSLVAKPAAKAAPEPTPEPKKVPAGRNLPRLLVTTVVEAFADFSDADKQRIANYLKVVTTGSDEAGHRWWPDETGFPRPTHVSWDA